MIARTWMKGLFGHVVARLTPCHFTIEAGVTPYAAKAISRSGDPAGALFGVSRTGSGTTYTIGSVKISERIPSGGLKAWTGTDNTPFCRSASKSGSLILTVASVPFGLTVSTVSWVVPICTTVTLENPVPVRVISTVLDFWNGFGEIPVMVGLGLWTSTVNVVLTLAVQVTVIVAVP